jgi:hypothetical protein
VFLQCHACCLKRKGRGFWKEIIVTFHFDAGLHRWFLAMWRQSNERSGVMILNNKGWGSSMPERGNAPRA